MKEMQCQLKAIRQDWLSKQVHGKVHHILPMCFHHSPSSHPFPISFPVLFQHLMWFPYLFPYFPWASIFFPTSFIIKKQQNTYVPHVPWFSICFHSFPIVFPYVSMVFPMIFEPFPWHLAAPPGVPWRRPPSLASPRRHSEEPAALGSEGPARSRGSHSGWKNHTSMR